MKTTEHYSKPSIYNIDKGNVQFYEEKLTPGSLEKLLKQCQDVSYVKNSTEKSISFLQIKDEKKIQKTEMFYEYSHWIFE